MEHLPPWLRGQPLPRRPTSRSAPEDTTPEWLRDVMPSVSSGLPAAQESFSSAESALPPDGDDDTPEWLRSLQDEIAEQPVAPTAGDAPNWLTKDAPETPARPLPIPHWLQDEDARTAGNQTMPDWLRNAEADSPQLEESSPPERPIASGATSWLSSLGQDTPPEPPPAEPAQPDTQSPSQSPSSRVRMPVGATDWLRSIGQEPDPDQPEKPPERDPTTAQRNDEQAADEPQDEFTIPDWLRDVSTEDLARDIAAAEADGFRFDDTPGPGSPSLFDDEAPAWLKSAEADLPPTDETISSWRASEPSSISANDSEAVDVPAWLRDVSDDAPRSGQRGAGGDEQFPPADLRTPDLDAFGADDDVPAWLRDAESAPTPERASAPTDDVPAWLRDAESAPAVEQPPTPEADVPAWLRDKPAAPATSNAETMDMPAWLRGAAESTAQTTTPATPDLPLWLRPDRDEPSAAPGTPGDAGLPAWLRGVGSEPVQQGADTGPTAHSPASGGESRSGSSVPTTRGRRTPDAEEGDGNDFFGGADLPGWLRLPEPERPSDPTATRTLDWLSRLGIQEEDTDVAIATSTPVVAPPRPTYTRSPAQLEAANVLRRLVESPFPTPAPVATPTVPSIWRRIGLERVLSIVLAVAVVIGLLTPQLTGAFQTTRPTAPSAPNLITAIDNLSDNDVVMLAYEWDAQRSSELVPLERAVTSHLIERNTKLVLVSTDPQGTMLSFDLIGPMRDAGYNIDRVNGRDAGGRDYVLLGYRPGGELALRSMAQDFRGMLRSDFAGRDATVGALATNLDGTPRLRTINDLSLIVVMADQPQDVQSWMEQIHSRAPDVPIAFLMPAETEPLVQPFLQSQNVLYLTGKQDALDYQLLRGQDGAAPALTESGQQYFIVVIFVALVIIGGFIGIFLREKRTT